MSELAAQVSPVERDELEAVLPLIAGYQRFYGAQPDDHRNAGFFARFLQPSDDGLLLKATDQSGAVIGFATLYWTFSSTTAEPVVLMNDLFVAEQARGTGAGRALIEAARREARDRGVRKLTWMTAPDNVTAQRLYDRTGASKSTWLEYELDV